MTNRGRQLLAPVFVDDVARLAADSLVDAAAADQVFELGGPETLPMREVIGRALAVAGLRRPILPGPTPLLKLDGGTPDAAAVTAPDTRRHRLHQPARDRGPAAPARAHAARADDAR